eukprot:COSAG02_NODE_69956_length_197_cov_222.734694_1_plen_27_part_10
MVIDPFPVKTKTLYQNKKTPWETWEKK